MAPKPVKKNLKRCRLVSTLRKPFGRPPLDVSDLYDHWEEWTANFGQSRGMLVLTVLLKFPRCRQLFARGYRYHSLDSTHRRRVFQALSEMANQFRDHDEYEQLRLEIDTIKGPLLAHGMLMVLRKLAVVERASEGIQLGAGKDRFRLLPYSRKAGIEIQKNIDLGPLLNTLRVPSSIRIFNENKRIVLKKFTSLGVCLLRSGSCCYNRGHTFRGYSLAEARVNGVSKLYVGDKDLVSELPGPDLSNARQTLGRDRTVHSLYETDRIRVPSEYITMAACLKRGKYGERAVGGQAASKRMRQGKCSSCFARRYSARRCRITLGHTGPARVDRRRRIH